MFKYVTGDLAATPLCTGFIAIEGTTDVVASIFAKNPNLVNTQLAPTLMSAAAKDPSVLARIKAMGDNPQFAYSLGPPTVAGSLVQFPFKLYQAP